MAITINDNIQVNAGKPTDNKYLNSSNATYTGVTEVNSRISVPERHLGLTVNVNNEEYWYATGVTDGDLILKSLGEQVQANNGLTKLGGIVSLGGTLTGDTTIDGTSRVCFGSFGGILTTFNVISDCLAIRYGDIVGGSNYGTISACNSGYQLNWIGNSRSVVLDIDNNGVLLNNTQTCDGIRYAHDYSALGSSNPRWIPDAGWVTGITSGITSYIFNNGITELNNTVSLGGTLTGNTTISGNSNNFILTGLTTLDLSATNINLTGIITLQTPPQTGSTSTDSVLVWNSSDNQVKQISPDNLGEDNNNYSVTAITSSTVNLTGSEYVVLLDTTTTGVTVTLSSSPIIGEAVKIKDKSGNALTNNITIDSGSGNTIDGSQCAVINTDYGGVELVYGDANSWYALSYIT